MRKIDDAPKRKSRRAWRVLAVLPRLAGPFLLACSLTAYAQEATPSYASQDFLAQDAAMLTASGQASQACLVEPWQISEVGSASPGILADIPVHRGDAVKKGDTVATLNSSVDEATLKLRQAEAAYLSRVTSRNEELYKRKLLPAGDYDEITSRARQARLQVELQQAILDERTIRSPFDGVVGERYAGPGDRINDNKILQIAQIDPLLVKVVVPEHDYGSIRQGDKASVSVSKAISEQPLEAEVWRIDRIMDAASGTFTVLLKVPNTDHAIPAGIRCSIRFGEAS